MKTALAAAEQKASELRTDQGPSRGASHDGNDRGGAGAGSGLGGLGNLAGLAGLTGLGGGVGGGGLDIASLMSNPALMSMASQMMQSGALNDIMNNPNVAEMAQNMMRGGNVEEMMNNPEIANLARQFAPANQGDAGGGNPGNNEANGETQ